ncbi:MAG: TlyA family RNA methyltransferase [Acidimicrobiales bacterium]
MNARRRLDLELVSKGLAETRAEAGYLVAQGRVLVGGAVAEKPSRQVGQSEPVLVTGPPPRFASRGGEKLEAALAKFQMDVRGKGVLDAGASTGGFTDCVLQRGAAQVVAVDVGYGQILPGLRSRDRVEVLERANVRYLAPGDLGGRRFDLVLADLSFISLVTVAGALIGLAKPVAELVLLVKPQFEVGKAAVSKGKGVVRAPELWAEAVCEVAGAFHARGARVAGTMVSPLYGAKGNVEFFLYLRTGWPPGPSAHGDVVDALVAAGRRGGR